DLDDFLDRHQGLADQLLILGARVVRDPLAQKVPHFVLVSSRRLDRVPAVFHRRHRASAATPSTRIFCSTQSSRPIAMPSTIERTRIGRVAWTSSGRVGKVTLSSSARTALMNPPAWATAPDSFPGGDAV